MRRLETGAGTRELLTVVVAGGGFAGTEMVAELFDLVHGVLHHYPGTSADEPRFVLVHAGERILPELSAELGAYALEKLRARGIEFRLGTGRRGGTRTGRLSDGERSRRARSSGRRATGPTRSRRRLRRRARAAAGPSTDPFLRVAGIERVWAIGDCARSPTRTAGPARRPPSTRCARARTVADNIAAVLAGRPPAEFRFQRLGMLVALGHRTAVAEIGGPRLSGLLAWLLWRAIYLAKLPGGGEAGARAAPTGYRPGLPPRHRDQTEPELPGCEPPREPVVDGSVGG